MTSTAPTTKECRNFLLAVVNAVDRSEVPYLRRYFARLYRDWFPKTDEHLQEWQVRPYYREVRAWWRLDEEEIPEEKPDTEFGYHVIVLRHKLKVIWTLASSGKVHDAEARIERISVWLGRYLRGPFDEPNEEWRTRLVIANGNLRYTLNLLKICENPECTSRYFIRDDQKKYCCSDCALRAQELRRRERIRLKLPRRVLTVKGKQKIGDVQRERWRKYRASKKLSSKKRSPDQDENTGV